MDFLKWNEKSTRLFELWTIILGREKWKRKKIPGNSISCFTKFPFIAF